MRQKIKGLSYFSVRRSVSRDIESKANSIRNTTRNKRKICLVSDVISVITVGEQHQTDAGIAV